MNPPLPSTATRPEALETTSLIDHILERYHETHRAQLPVLIALAERVERVHAAHPQAPEGLTELLMEIAADLEQHQQKEEQILFPMMRLGGTPMIGFPLRRMMVEHDEVEVRLLALKALTDDFTPPSGACGTWRRLYEEALIFHQDLTEHMRLENDALFPRYLD